MTTREEATAELAQAVGQALLRFAGQMRDLPRDAPATGAATPHRVAPGLGAAQEQVLAALRGAGEDGMTSHAVALETDLQNSNTPRILKALQRRGLVVSSGEKPAVWTVRAEQVVTAE